MSAILEWWTDNGNQVLTQAAAGAGATFAIALLAIVLRVVRTLVVGIGRVAYVLLMSWWVAPLRRWLTGSPW